MNPDYGAATLPIVTSYRTFLVTGGFILALLLLGVADAQLTKKTLVMPEVTAPDSTGAETMKAPIEGGVEKQSGPAIESVLEKLQMTSGPASEASILSRVVPDAVTTWVLLKNGDRAGMISFVDSPNVKTYFIALKEALQKSFSPGLKDLLDETQEREGKPIRNILTFFDPAISEERTIFVRVRERLYEFHIAKDKDGDIFALVDALTE